MSEQKYQQTSLKDAVVGLQKVRDAGVAAERSACAEIVRVAGCLCQALHIAWPAQAEAFFSDGDAEPGERGEVLLHDPRCPLALAAAIEKRGEVGG